jgi:DNA-binding transcriptional regulator LsrR (DeoR family)
MREPNRRGRPRRSTAEVVLHLRYRRGRTAREIAESVGCTRQWVNRILAEHRPLIERLSA